MAKQIPNEIVEAAIAYGISHVSHHFPKWWANASADDKRELEAIKRAAYR
ncbi:hypothetical protein LX16_4401 [Stackebrandtia albiflava]|uniref:Uncharacterized protein n=1 Tax=Stackebrandtia albiflava TaxID=406432 RepID=A0A562URD3_9ACTN|nr:hypothetical protein [Stackebrandtia albiflava]TWJ08180.1 hypothetical protein LX16_4401 [Stackebrandtia albiflava]